MEPTIPAVILATAIAIFLAWVFVKPEPTTGAERNRPTCVSCGNKCGPQRYSLNGSDYCESCTQQMGLPHF